MTKTRPKPVLEKKKVAIPNIPQGNESGTTSQDRDIPIVEISALRESEQFLKETEKIAKIGGWKANPDTDYLQWTDGIYDIVEAPRNYQPGFNEGSKYFSEKDLPLIRKNIETCLDYRETIYT